MATRAVSVPAQRSKEMNLTLLSCRKNRFIQRGEKTWQNTRHNHIFLTVSSHLKVNISLCPQRSAGARRGRTRGQAGPGRRGRRCRHAEPLPANQQRDLWGVRDCMRLLGRVEVLIHILKLTFGFQNEDKEKERRRQRELEEARTKSPKTDADHDDEEYEEDNDEEPDDTRQTPENGSTGERSSRRTSTCLADNRSQFYGWVWLKPCDFKRHISKCSFF